MILWILRVISTHWQRQRLAGRLKKGQREGVSFYINHYPWKNLKYSLTTLFKTLMRNSTLGKDWHFHSCQHTQDDPHLLQTAQGEQPHVSVFLFAFQGEMLGEEGRWEQSIGDYNAAARSLALAMP